MGFLSLISNGTHMAHRVTHCVRRKPWSVCVSRGFSNKCLDFKRPDLLGRTLSQTCCLSAVHHGRSYSGVTQHEAVSLPRSARVVVCGGGVVGSSMILHLAEAGWKDIVLLEQGSIACGTSWHAAGLIGRLRGSAPETAICTYSTKLYAQLEQEGYHTGWKNCGSINVSRGRDRMIMYERYLLNAERFGVAGDQISLDEVSERIPILRTDDLEGAFWLPDDGTANPTDVAMAMSKKARDLGATVIQGVKVQRVLTVKDRVAGVETDHGNIQCEVFVNTAGQWARDIGQLSDPPVRVPLHSCEHYYLVTKPFGNIDSMMPVVRDYDGYVYLREWSGGILGGGFEPVAKPVFHEGIPDKFEFQLLQEDWDHFQILLDGLLHRVPSLETAEVRQLTNGPEAFTPDGKWILGEAPEVKNYFIAAGMNSTGIAGAGGIGKFMTEWILNGRPSMDFWGLDCRRFVDLHNNKKFLKDRVRETLAMVGRVHSWETDTTGYTSGRKLRLSTIYTRVEPFATFGQGMGYERPLYFSDGTTAEDDACWFTGKPVNLSQSSCYISVISVPNSNSESACAQARGVRVSMMYPRLQECGAEFGQMMGYERSLWFKGDTDDYTDEDTKARSVFGKPAWFDKVKSEYWACRKGVCLIDMSTFTKFELRSAGREVVDFLQYVCSNDVDKDVGTIIHTGMQNELGGYENDCSVIRMDTFRYFMIGPTAQQTRAWAWLKQHLPVDGSVQLSDVTSMYTAVNVIGPKAQELLAELTDTPLNRQDFMHMTCKVINVGQASGIKAMRLTHSGEDGWTLYIPSEYALHVYDSLMSAGKNYGVRNAGYYALRALRTEKFFAYWGTDLTAYVTPLECGRDFRVKFDKGGFLGYPALLKQKTEGVRKKLVQFLLKDHNLEEDLWPWGGEPIYRNGRYCGSVTSTAYGFTLDRHICLGYVSNYDDDGTAQIVDGNFVLDSHASYEINIAGKKFPAKATIHAKPLPPAGIMINSRV